MSISNIINIARDIEALEEQKLNANDILTKEICDMQIDVLKKDLHKDIEKYVSSGEFNKNDRYRIQIECQNISLTEPTVFDVLVAFEDYLRSKEHYYKEKTYLSRDLTNILLNKLRVAKDNLISIMCAFMRNFNYH